MAFRIQEPGTFAQQVDFLEAPALPDSSIPMSKLSDAAADLPAQKVTQQRIFKVDFAGNPATGRYFLGRAKSAWTVKYFELYIGDAPSSGTLSVMPKHCDGSGGALANMLSGAVTSTSGDSDRTVKSGTLSVTSGAAGSVFELDVTEGTGAAAIGATLCIEEAAEA